jgi:L-ascorbate metabolism protein UlaG (beta-lactamase superfamily)
LRLHHVRNATSRLTYGSLTCVVDPSLGPAHSWPPLGAIANPQPNPLVDLPIQPQDVFTGVDAVLQTHLHIDHLDDTGVEELRRGMPVFCQPTDEPALSGRGLTTVEPIQQSARFAGVTIHRVDGEHGFGPVADRLGPSSGYVLTASGEPTLYIAGDTVWCDVVAETIQRHKPDVIILNAGGAELASGDRIIMDEADVAEVAAAAPDADLVLVHLDAVSHCLSTRARHRHTFPDHDHVHIPEDGGHLIFAPTTAAVVDGQERDAPEE